MELLIALPGEILAVVARHALGQHLPSALNLRFVCTPLRAKLEWLQAEAKALRQLTWVDDVHHRDVFINDGKTLLRPTDGVQALPSSSFGTLLPTAGKSSWKVSIDCTHHNQGFVMIGVGDAAKTCAWALLLQYGNVHTEKMPPDYSIPAGFPTPLSKQVIFTADGQHTGLAGRANGAVIEVLVDHDEGVLRFAIDGGPPLQHVLEGFPLGAALRPYAYLYWGADQVSFSGYLRRDVVM